MALATHLMVAAGVRMVQPARPATLKTLPSALFGSERTALSCAHFAQCGVMHVLASDGGKHGYYARNTRAEIVSGANLVRGIMQPVLPMLLFSSARDLAWLREAHLDVLWDKLLELTMDMRLDALYRRWQHANNCTNRNSIRCPKSVAWRSIGFWKTSALLQSPFQRTVYLDNDVYVLQPTYMHSLLSQTLRACDIAMPLNIDRSGVWQATSVPQPCNGLIAWRKTPDVEGLLVGAIERIVSGVHDGVDPSGNSVDQRDQDMLYFEWFEARPELRFLMLPEEYYCPDSEVLGISPYNVRNWKGGFAKGKLKVTDTSSAIAHWKTTWTYQREFGTARQNESKYKGTSYSQFPCKAVHGHGKV